VLSRGRTVNAFPLFQPDPHLRCSGCRVVEGERHK